MEGRTRRFKGEFGSLSQVEAEETYKGTDSLTLAANAPSAKAG